MINQQQQASPRPVPSSGSTGSSTATTTPSSSPSGGAVPKINLREARDAELVQNTLNKANKGRTELQILVNTIEGLPHFERQVALLSTQQVDALLAFKHEFFNKSEVVFKRGERGAKFYIVLRGEVTLLVPELVRAAPQHLQDLARSLDPSSFNRLLSGEEKRLKGLYPELKIARVFAAAECFGELSLITDEPRQATVVCREDCHLMAIDKVHFLKIFGKFYYRELGAQIDFLQRFPCFREIRQQQQQQLLYKVLNALTVQKYCKNHVVYNEQSEADSVYFVKSGEIQILKELRLAESVVFGSGQQRQTNVTARRVPISVMGSGSYFGAEEVLNGQTHREHLAMCASAEAELLVLHKVDYMAVVMQGSAQQQEDEEALNQSRLSFQEKRIEDIQAVAANLASAPPPPPQQQTEQQQKKTTSAESAQARRRQYNRILRENSEFMIVQPGGKKRANDNSSPDEAVAHQQQDIDSAALTTNKIAKKKFAVEWGKLNRCKERVLDKLMTNGATEQQKLLSPQHHHRFKSQQLNNSPEEGGGAALAANKPKLQREQDVVTSKDAGLPGKNNLDIFLNNEPLTDPKKYTVFEGIAAPLQRPPRYPEQHKAPLPPSALAKKRAVETPSTSPKHFQVIGSLSKLYQQRTLQNLISGGGSASSAFPAVSRKGSSPEAGWRTAIACKSPQLGGGSSATQAAGGVFSPSTNDDSMQQQQQTQSAQRQEQCCYGEDEYDNIPAQITNNLNNQRAHFGQLGNAPQKNKPQGGGNSSKNGSNGAQDNSLNRSTQKSYHRSVSQHILSSHESIIMEDLAEGPLGTQNENGLEIVKSSKQQEQQLAIEQSNKTLHTVGQQGTISCASSSVAVQLSGKLNELRMINRQERPSLQKTKLKIRKFLSPDQRPAPSELRKSAIYNKGNGAEGAVTNNKLVQQYRSPMGGSAVFFVQHRQLAQLSERHADKTVEEL